MDRLEIVSTIEERVEYSVSEKINKINKWLISIFITMFVLLFAFFVGNAYWMGTIDTKIQSMTETFKDSKIEVDKLKMYEQNQLIILMHIKRLDPDFDLGLIMRGDTNNHKNDN